MNGQRTVSHGQVTPGMAVDGLCLVAGGGLWLLAFALAFVDSPAAGWVTWGLHPAVAAFAGAASAYLREGRVRRLVRVLMLEAGTLLMLAWALFNLVESGEVGFSLRSWFGASGVGAGAFVGALGVTRWGRARSRRGVR